jgi:hypothetical protein
MFCCCLCHLCSIQNGIGRYELKKMVDIEWHVFQWTKGVQTFYGKGPLPLLWAGSRVARGKITRGVCHQLHYCGLCPRVGDPSRKWNCMLNRSLGTLQLSRAPIIVNVVSVAVITWAVRMCHGTACESWKFPPVPVSITISVIPNAGGTCS